MARKAITLLYARSLGAQVNGCHIPKPYAVAEDLSIALPLTLEWLSPLDRLPSCCTPVRLLIPRSGGVPAACVRARTATRRQPAARRVRTRWIRSTCNSCPHSWRPQARAISARSRGCSWAKWRGDGRGNAPAALNVLGAAGRAGRFLFGAARKAWREDFPLRFATIDGLPGVIVDGLCGPVRKTAPTARK